MKHGDRWFLSLMIGGVLLLIAGMMVWSARPASAQCGTSASSCKNCHETQGVLPVSANGAWHSTHAFGDFCEFCHAGNVQAKEKDAAHVGLVAPLDDVKAGCQSCHPADFMDRAQIYASTLGVSVGTGSGGGSSGSAGGGGSTSVGATGVGAPLGGEEIDFNLLYAEALNESAINWGNVILALMTLGVAGAFLVTAWTWENWGEKVAGWIDRNVAPVPQAIAAAAQRGDSPAMMGQALASQDMAQLQALLAQKPELQALLPRLMACTPETLAALQQILANPERGGEILSAVSKADMEVVATLRELGAKDRNLLLALVRDI